MTPSSRTALLAVLVAVALAPARAQIPAQAPRDARTVDGQQRAGSGVIAGVVLTADQVARPLRFANVVLIGALTGTLRVTSTDVDGRFSFADLPADRYIVGASKPPYLGSVAGARRPARPGTPIALSNGQKIEDVGVHMPLGAAITGVVTDERGKPAVNSSIGLMQWKMQGGERTLIPVSNTRANTDERGRYRIFGLPPGEYIVGTIGAPLPQTAQQLSDAEVDAAMAGGAAAAAAAAAAIDSSVKYAAVFYPGTTRSADATPVTLTVGEERQSVDFRLELVRSVRVEGTVGASDGQLPSSGSVILTQLSNGVTAGGALTRVMPGGGFSFPNVMPGSYTLTAMVAAAPAAAARGIPSGPGSQFASTAIEVAGSDLSGVQLTLRPSAQISGHLVFAGSSAPSLAGRQMPVRLLGPMPLGPAGPMVSLTNAAGLFSISRLVPGRYIFGGPMFFGASGDSVTWSLQSVVVDGIDTTDLPFDVTAEKPPKDVVVTYGDGWQEVSGKLLQSAGGAATDYALVVFPVDKAYWQPNSRRILVTRPSTDGSFTFGGPGPNTIPPGSYLLAAVTDIDRDEQFDPAFLTTLMQAATPVVIGAGERRTQDLVVR